MSGALSTISSIGLGFGVSSLLSGTNSLAFIGDALITPYRAIGTIIPDVLIEEINRDELEITQHPIEFGTPITDHSFMRPLEVILRVGWSNAGQYPGYIHDVYNQLLSLQASRVPFQVFTGKRIYNNMLMAGLIQTSNAQSGDYTLMVQAVLREIIIVSTSAVQVPASALPQKTLDFSGLRSQQPQSVSTPTNSALNTQTQPFSGVDALTIPENPSFGPTNLLGGA